ncbi:universal stress protein UspA [Natronorubrum sp. JWXQ-INN-674]|uniref:Universal stress protein UspA n=1 Tax=Natronorubrum halalkaliphilum TaxID=2691917 RepID=A0A6B0VS25_9EURY|nr:universal stress protein UspA [Natronorubrum halalkaliphilum]MXV63857.1 universal stress protein UspA [Natronorubrum halalkaliphilum]
MHYLVGTDSVHTTAAICDYLEERATGDDTVTVVALAPTDDATARRDAQEALNVAPVRLVAVGDVRTELRDEDGSSADRLLEMADDVDADELLVTARSPVGPSTSSDSSRQSLLEEASLPVVVVPDPVR